MAGRLAALVVLCLAAPLGAPAATLHVPSQFPNIQAAVDASADGDSILVAAGTLEEPQGVKLFGRELTIVGAGRDETFITSAFFCFEIREESNIKVSRVDIKSTGVSTAAFVVVLSQVEVEESRIHDSDGGGAGGGAISAAAYSEVVCRDVEFLRNRGITGAVSVTALSHLARFENCLFKDNETSSILNDAGALEVASTTVELVNCVFQGNKSIAGLGGTVGTIHYYGQPSGSMLIDNCLIVDNHGQFHGAILAEFGGEVTIRNSTIAANTGQVASALTHIEPTVTTIENCILASNGPGPPLLCGLVDAGPISVTCTDIWDNAAGPECAGPGNISLDPRFCGEGRWDLLSDSPCAPSANPSCGLMGARGVACLTSLRAMTWGRLKSLMLGPEQH